MRSSEWLEPLSGIPHDNDTVSLVVYDPFDVSCLEEHLLSVQRDLVILFGLLPLRMNKKDKNQQDYHERSICKEKKNVVDNECVCVFGSYWLLVMGPNYTAVFSVASKFNGRDLIESLSLVLNSLFCLSPPPADLGQFSYPKNYKR